MYLARFIGNTLKNTARGRAYGDNSAAGGSAAVYFLRNCLGHYKILGVHKVILYAVNLYGTEGAKSYVKGYLTVAYALFFYFSKKLLCEMQSRSGSGS